MIARYFVNRATNTTLWRYTNLFIIIIFIMLVSAVWPKQTSKTAFCDKFRQVGIGAPV